MVPTPTAFIPSIEAEDRIQEEMRPCELPADYMESEPAKPRVSVQEASFDESEVKTRLAMYGADVDTVTKEPQYDLYMLPDDPVCKHLKLYMDLEDLNDMFRSTNVSTIPLAKRPAWLQGIPSIAVPCDHKDELRLLVGEEALKFVRELVDGPEDASDDLEVVDARDQSSLTINTDDLWHDRVGKLRPEDEQELLHFLLPLPRNHCGVLEAVDTRTDPDAVRKMMAMRSAMFESDAI